MRTRHWLPTLFIACAPLLVDCGPSHSVPPAAQSAGARLYAYDLLRPSVDAAFAAKTAAKLGVSAPPEADGAIWRMADGARLVTVHKDTGGFRYYDYAKYGDDGYRIDPASRSRADVERAAKDYVRSLGLLPDGALVNDVRVEAGRGGAPNRWAVQFGFRVAAGVDADGHEQQAALKGALGAVFVGNGEIVAMEWDYPALARRTTTLPDTQGVLKQAAEGTDSTVGFVELTYWYTAFGENQPRLDPRAVYAPLGAGLVVRPSTQLRPEIADVADEVSVELPAGEAIALDAPSVSGGTAPYAYRWEALIAGRPATTLSTEASVRATLPHEAVGVKLVVSDAEGMSAERAYIVSSPHPDPSHVEQLQAPGPTPTPINNTAVLSGTWAQWTAELVAGPGGGGGLALGSVHANGRLVADLWSLPSFTVTTEKMVPSFVTCQLGAGCSAKRIESDCWNGTIYRPFSPIPINCINDGSVPLPWAVGSSDKWAIRGGQAYYKRPFNDKSLVIRSVWQLDLGKYTSTTCQLVVAQTYVMEPMNNQDKYCDNVSNNLCAKFYPIVQYFYMNSSLTAACTTDEVKQISFDQKFEEDLWDHATANGDISLFISDQADVTGPLGYLGFAPQMTERTATMAVGSAPGGSEYWATASNSTKDNVHERPERNQIYVPGCYSVIDSPTMQCSHMHWNWGKAWPLGSTASQAPFHIGTPLVPGSQTVTATIAIDRPAEFLTPGPGIANNETIVTVGSGSLYPYIGSKLVTAVDTTCSGAGGRSGSGEPRGARTYDHIGLNSYFFE